MQRIEHDGYLVAIIYRDEDWVEGLNFVTPNEMFVQVGSWWYKKGRKLASHIHNDFERSAMRTQEMTYVKKGSMRVLLFDEQKNYIGDYVDAADQFSVRWDDPKLGIDWPVKNPTLSERDKCLDNLK